MNDKLFVSEKTLRKLLRLIEQIACKNDKDEHVKLLYQLAPEIKTSHRQLTVGGQY